jgi:hypothetical protein
VACHALFNHPLIGTILGVQLLSDLHCRPSQFGIERDLRTGIVLSEFDKMEECSKRKLGGFCLLFYYLFSQGEWSIGRSYLTSCVIFLFPKARLSSVYTFPIFGDSSCPIAGNPGRICPLSKTLWGKLYRPFGPSRL